MYYITVKQPPSYHQMTLEEFLFGSGSGAQLINANLQGRMRLKKLVIDFFSLLILTSLLQNSNGSTKEQNI